MSATKKCPRFDEEKHPYCQRFRLDDKRIMATEQSQEHFKEWCIISERERLLRIKQTKLTNLLTLSQSQTIVFSCIERMIHLHRFMKSHVYNKKQEFIDTSMFSDDPSVKGLFREDDLIQMSGCLKNRYEEADRLIDCFTHALEYPEKIDGFVEIWRQNEYSQKSLTSNYEGATLEGICLCSDDDDDNAGSPENKNRFVSHKAFVKMMMDSDVNKENPAPKWYVECLQMIMISLLTYQQYSVMK